VFVGGVVTQAFGWPAVFYVTIPITCAALVLAPMLFDGKAGETRRRFDVAGSVTVTGAALAFIYSILTGAERGLSIEVIVALATGAALLAAFILIERRAAEPLVPLGIFRGRAVSAGVAIGFLGGAARVSTFFLSALLLQQVLELEPAIAGTAMVPTSVAGFVVSVALLSRILKRWGAERTLVVGLVLLAAGHGLLARVPTDASYVVDVLPALLLAAAGVALSFTPSTMVIASGLDSEQSGLASGLANASSQIGGAVGIALFSAILAVGTVGALSSGLGAETSVTAGFQAAYLAAALVALVAAAIGLVALWPRSRPVDAQPDSLKA
jgi:predicted MFS family arabinose efflux permease